MWNLQIGLCISADISCAENTAIVMFSKSSWQPLPAISFIEAWVLGMREWTWFMNVFYAHVPRRSEVMPRSAVVLGEPHLCSEDLGRGRCPDCAVVPWPQMFGCFLGGGSEPVCWDLSSLCGQLLWDSLPEPSWPPEAAGKWRRCAPAVSLAAAPHHSSVLIRLYWRPCQLSIVDVQKHPAVSHLRVKLKLCIQLHVLFTSCDDKNALFICSHYEQEYQSHLFVFLISTFEPVECPYWTLKSCFSRHITVIEQLCECSMLMLSWKPLCGGDCDRVNHLSFKHLLLCVSCQHVT